MRGKVDTAEAAAEAAEAAASKSVLAIHSIYEKLSNELPTYQVLPNELGFISNSENVIAFVTSKN